jgi:hypothetical protein
VVTDDRERVVRNYTVIVFAADAGQRYQSSRFVVSGDPDNDGTFALRDVPPGEYYVVAVNRRQLEDVQGRSATLRS